MKPAALALALALAACARRDAAPGGAFRVHELLAPAAPGSSAPNLAVTADERMLLSWIEPSGDNGQSLRFAVRRKGGAWSPPRMVAQGYDWYLNWAESPSLAALPDGTLFAHWLARNGSGAYGYDVRVSASRDGGGSWTPFVTPHRDGTLTEHGFVAMAPWDAGHVSIVWLDGRKTSGSGEADADPLAAMQLMQTTIDAEGRLGSETLLDERVCDCCQTAAVRSEGGMVVVYRDRSPAEIRDISFMRFESGRWTAPRTLAADSWHMNGCPVNGPALSASGAELAAAWFTAPDDAARVSVAFSTDAGRSFAAPRAVDDGRPLGRVGVALLPGGGALVSWLEQTASGAELRVRRVDADGARGASVVVARASASRSVGFPRLQVVAGEPLVAWRDAGEPARIRTAVLEPIP